MDFDIRLARDRTGGYVAYCPQLPYCLTLGHNEDEARVNISILIRDWIQTDRILANKGVFFLWKVKSRSHRQSLPGCPV
jgi:predicted RNase H-like HicB family nuclease